MLQIKGNDIYLTKGDSAFIAIGLWQNGQQYEAKDGDKVTISVKKSFEGDAVIEQKVNVGEAFIFSSAETTIDVGRYRYDVQLNTADGYVFTVAGGDFFVTMEVTA